MSFKSVTSVVIPHSVDQIFPAFSTDEQFSAIMQMSPLTTDFTITKSDFVILKQDLTYRADSGDVLETEERVRRIHWVLKEQVSYLGIPVNVEVIGTQLVSERQRLHVYEGSANNGQVFIHKVRRFESVNGNSTKISEVINGRTMWILSLYVGWECRKAHAKQVARYPELPMTKK